jgi:choline-sulfatase
MTPRPPNLLLITCDQLRAFELGCWGNPLVRTPHLDALAAAGARFATAVTNQPVCMAARSVLLSGQYARRCTGGIGNVSLPAAPGDFAMPEYPQAGRPHLPDPTLPERLRARGYRTAAIGKWHIHSWPHEVGFDQYLIPRVHHCHTGQSYTRDGGPEFVPPGYSVDFEAAEVERFLAAQRAGPPFFLYYNISPPHCPLADAPERYLRMYRPEDVPLRGNVRLDTPLANQDYWFKVYRHDFRYYSLHLPHTETLPPGYSLRHVIAEYCGLTTWVDDTVGRLLAALAAAGLAQDTIVVFTADHGDNLGSHGRVQKGTLNEESIRIPLILRVPGLPPGRVHGAQVASLVDLAPTLLELAGDEVPRHMHGHSLAPVLRGAVEALAEPGAFIETGGDGVGLRTPQHLYGLPGSRTPGMLGAAPHYFHDLAADPWQLDNRAATGRDTECARDLDRRLRAWHGATPGL